MNRGRNSVLRVQSSDCTDQTKHGDRWCRLRRRLVVLLCDGTLHELGELSDSLRELRINFGHQALAVLLDTIRDGKVGVIKGSLVEDRDKLGGDCLGCGYHRRAGL